MTFIPSRITIVLSHCLTAFEGKIHAESDQSERGRLHLNIQVHGYRDKRTAGRRNDADLHRNEEVLQELEGMPFREGKMDMLAEVYGRAAGNAAGAVRHDIADNV